MTQVILPHGESNPGKAEWPEVYANDKALRDVVNGGIDNGNLSGSAGFTRANLAVEAKPVKWYPPTIVAATETTASAGFTTLGTADEVKEVVVPEGALLLISYAALVRETNGGGKSMSAAIFIGASQVRDLTQSGDEYTTTQSSPWKAICTGGSSGSLGDTTFPNGLGAVGDNGSEEMPSVGLIGQIQCFAPAGTYNVAVKYKAGAGGNAAAKHRRLYVGVMGATA